MSRPLIITDCDEVLLHMVVPFREWLDEAHGIHFDLRGHNFADALRHKGSDVPLEREIVWSLLSEFFASQMHRQYPVSGAVEALDRLSGHADIVVLTNIAEHEHEGRIEQLRRYGIDYPVFCNNRGGKGPPLASIIADRQPSVALFIDDLGVHHRSVAEHAPDVWRLQMIAEPEVAREVEPAAEAHARIDDWPTAETWIAERLSKGRPEAA